MLDAKKPDPVTEMFWIMLFSFTMSSDCFFLREDKTERVVFLFFFTPEWHKVTHHASTFGLIFEFVEWSKSCLDLSVQGKMSLTSCSVTGLNAIMRITPIWRTRLRSRVSNISVLDRNLGQQCSNSNCGE